MKARIVSALLVMSAMVLLVGDTKCQSAQNSVYLEVGGSTFIGSVNYERFIADFSDYRISGTAGYLFWPFATSGKRTVHGMPLGLRVYKNVKGIDLFGSVAYAYVSDFEVATLEGLGEITTRTQLSIVSLRFGARKYFGESGWFFSASIQGSLLAERSETSSTNTQLFRGATVQRGFQPWAAIATGKSF